MARYRFADGGPGGADPASVPRHCRSCSRPRTWHLSGRAGHGRGEPRGGGGRRGGPVPAGSPRSGRPTSPWPGGLPPRPPVALARLAVPPARRGVGPGAAAGAGARLPARCRRPDQLGAADATRPPAGAGRDRPVATGRRRPDRRRRRLQVVMAPMRTRDLRGVLAIEEASSPSPGRTACSSRSSPSASHARYRAAWVGPHRGRLRRADVHRRRGPREQHRRRPRRGRVGASGGACWPTWCGWPSSRGARHLTLEVRVGNEPALALYRRFGLAPVGVRAQLLPGDRRRRPDHVGPGHRHRGLRRRLSAIEAGSAELAVTSRR